MAQQIVAGDGQPVSTLKPSSYEEQKQTEEHDETALEEWKPTLQEWVIMITMGITAFLTALDASILVTVLPIIAHALNGSAVETFWAGTSYLLANAVVQPFLAALSDVFGRREVMVPSLILFTAGSAIAGAATSFAMLLAGRCIQGVGGGGIICIYQLVFADIVPLRQRPRYFNIVVLTWALGLMSGPIIGAAFGSKVSWRWCFYINLPILAVALPLSVFYFNLRPPTRTSLLVKLRRIDWLGCTLFTTSITILMVALTNGGVGQPWSSWRTLTPLTIGGIGLVATIVWDWKWARNPLLPREIFPNFSSVVIYLAALVQGFLLYMNLYYVALYLLAVKLEEPIQAGVKELPALVITVFSSGVSSSLITKFGSYRWAIWLGYAVICLGNGLMIMADEGTSQAVYTSFFAVFGIGLGLILTSCNFASQAAVRDTIDSGRAAAMYAFMRALGMCVGVAIGGTIFLNTMQSKLSDLGLPTSIAEDAEGYLHQVLRHMDPTDPMFKPLLQAYASGVRGIFVGMTGIAAGGLVLSAGVRHYSMDKLLTSRYTARRRETENEVTIEVESQQKLTPEVQHGNRSGVQREAMQQGWTDIEAGQVADGHESGQKE